MSDKIRMNGGAAESAPGPATAEPPAEAPLPTAPTWAGPPVQVAVVFWKKDVSLQIPGAGAAQTRLVAWEATKLAPSYVIQYCPKIRQFWVCSLTKAKLDGVEQNPARWVPADHAVTWQEWRGEEDIPAAARRRIKLAAQAREEDAERRRAAG